MAPVHPGPLCFWRGIGATNEREFVNPNGVREVRNLSWLALE